MRVHNRLLTDGISIHWHGLHVEKTPWMDGVAPHVQCPIQPSTTFTYRFKASPVGTHWYHDHYENQRGAGLYGAFVVHEPVAPRPRSTLEFVVMVTDWYHTETEESELTSPTRLGKRGTGEHSDHWSARDAAVDGSEETDLTYESSLINGRGRYRGLKTPLSVFTVQPASVYRFRVINAASERSFVISVDDHDTYIVSVDGSPVKSQKADYIVIHAGERVDFVMHTRVTTGKYWLRARTTRVGKDPHGFVQEVRAIIRYRDAPAAGDPSSNSRVCSSLQRCEVFNCPFAGYPADQYRDCINVDRLQSGFTQQHLANTFGLDDRLADESFYNWANVGLGSSVNGRKLIGARGVPFYQTDFNDYTTPCDPVECDANGCVCTHYVVKDYNVTVQMVFTNYAPNHLQIAHHPIHTHGIHFAVLKMGYPNYDSITGRYLSPNEAIVCNNHICSVPRWNNTVPALNKRRPPIKDTIIVPFGGYVVLRFRTTNPGLWLIHCHLASHAMEGMGFYFFEAVDKIPRLPDNFPKCGDYELTADEYNYYQNLPIS